MEGEIFLDTTLVENPENCSIGGEMGQTNSFDIGIFN